MQVPPFPPDETSRLAALGRLQILDTPPERVFDDLVALAADICEVPISALSLIDTERQFFKASIGLSVRETSRDVSFCGHTILSPELHVVPAAALDARFADNPLVVGSPGIGFYAGAPLMTSDGHALGALCVIDRVERTLSDRQLHMLARLARQGSELLEARRVNLSLNQVNRALEQAIQERTAFEARLQAIVDAALDAIVAADSRGIVLAWNQAAQRMFGFSEAEIVGRPLTTIMPASFHAAHAAGLARFAASGTSRLAGKVSRLQGRHKDGRIFEIELSLGTWSVGQERYFTGVLRDVTARIQTEAALERERAQGLRQAAIMTSVLGNMGDGVIVTDERGEFVLYNEAAVRMLGRGPEHGTPDAWPDGYGLFSSDGLTPLPFESTPLHRALRGEHVSQFEILTRTPEHPRGRWHSVTSGPIHDAKGSLIGTVSVGRDITQRKDIESQLEQQAQELRQLAFNDELTGLYNRRGFLLLAEHQLLVAMRQLTPALLLYVDLDGMKQINDQLGHDEGDRALRDTAQVIRAVIREADVAARLGGDEFAVLMVAAGASTESVVLERFSVALAQHRSSHPRSFRLQMSFGVTRFDPSKPIKLESLLAEADALMYEQKRQRRSPPPVALEPAPG
jgi:diguanylate cyclase (GGDEF)-like protein/PAS domain S-box-containing protein